MEKPLSAVRLDYDRCIEHKENVLFILGWWLGEISSANDLEQVTTRANTSQIKQFVSACLLLSFGNIFALQYCSTLNKKNLFFISIVWIWLSYSNLKAALF